MSELYLEHWKLKDGRREPHPRCGGTWSKKRDMVLCTGCDARWPAVESVLARAGADNHVGWLIRELASTAQAD